MRPLNGIGVRQLRVGDRLVTVELYQNEGKSVAARCLIGVGDTPIVDAPSVDEAIAALEDIMEGVLLARRSAA
jgi:hypothetical protein